MNKKCKYAELIKIALEKRKEISGILNKYREENLDENWYPAIVYCEKCKTDFTNIINSKNYEIEYECRCGFRNKIDFRKKGVVKLVWRVDWPMRWKYESVDFEPGGIDHSTPGGSYTTAKEIVKKIFNYKVPLYQLYEWVRIKGGTEFSSSRGNVLTLDEIEQVYEPEILRYLFVATRPNKGFPISFDNDVIKIYEEYDRLEEKYYSKKASQQEKRIYELSQIKLRKNKPERIGFRHLATLVQIGKTKNLKGESKERAKRVANWLEKYAGDDMRFEVQERVIINLNKKEKQSLNELKKLLQKKKYNEKELFNEFYNICEKVGIDNKDFFKTSYKVIINKEKGPRLAQLILNIGQDKIIKLLSQIK